MIITLNGINDPNTVTQLKTYFDVSSYRNALDMLNTFDIGLKNFGYSLVFSVNGGTDTRVDPVSEVPVLYNKAYISKQKIGFSIPIVGKSRWNSLEAPNKLLKYALKNNGLGGINAKTAIEKHTLFNIYDLLNMSRNINWELNRLRLPVPDNFRQINSLIQNKPYFGRTFLVAGYQESYPPEPDTEEYGIPFKNFVNLYQLINVYGKLKKSITAMRIGLRAEIDKANVAKKVQEETLRKENDAILSAKKIKEQVIKQAVIIEEQRKKQAAIALKEAAINKQKLIYTQKKLNDAKTKLANIKPVTKKQVEIIKTKIKAVDKAAKETAIKITETSKYETSISDTVKKLDNKTKKDIIGVPLKSSKSYIPLVIAVVTGVLLK